MKEKMRNAAWLKYLPTWRRQEILWVDHPTQLKELAERLRVESRLAVDLEADSLYRYRERICLLQICSSRESALIDSLALPDLRPLRPVLENPCVEKVFHGADYDLRLLKGAGLAPRGIFDTMVAAQCLGAKRLGLSDLLEERLGIRLDKRFQKADWSKRPLPESMVEYAVEDTSHLLALRDSLGMELEALGRLQWAKAHFLDLEKIEPLRREPLSALKTKGARELDGQSRGVLQALLEWREEEARCRDVPVFKVLRTETLVSLAREKPLDLQSLLRIPGITKRVLEMWGEGLLRAVQEGLKRAPISFSGPPGAAHNPPGSRKRFLALKEIRDGAAHREGLHPGVLCPNSLLQALALCQPRDLERRMEELLRPWQRSLLGERFREVLSREGRKK